MDYDINNLYLGGLSIGNHYMWGSAGSGKSQIFSKLNGKWRGEDLGKKFNSPFKKA